MQERGGPTSEFSPRAERVAPAWIHEARTMLPGPGRYLAYLEDEETIRIFPIERGWTRIGRSAAADVRLDDPSVSRRHALVVSEQPSSLRVLDDRSLNGVLLNGERVEWARLADGDELAIGRYRLFALEA
jgi:pSer/pThr/pTyr-binding forkhead associated (FHA) protein